MRRGTQLVFATAVALAVANCGGSLTAPGVPGQAPADAGADTSPGHSIIRVPRMDATVPPPDGFGGMGMNPCRNKIAEPIDGTVCQFLIPDAAVCTGIGIRVHVLIDLVEQPQGADDGWTFIDASETSVELHGAACERATASATGVTISFTTYLP